MQGEAAAEQQVKHPVAHDEAWLRKGPLSSEQHEKVRAIGWTCVETALMTGCQACRGTVANVFCIGTEFAAT